MERTPSEEALLRGAVPTPPAMSPAGNAANKADEVYLEHAPLLRRIAIRKFGVPADDAPSLVHDVFATYFADPGTVRSDLRSFLVGAICNASRNYWRAQHSARRVFSDGQSTAEILAAKDTFEGLAAQLTVAAALARMDRRCREVLERYYLQGESTNAIAGLLHTSPGNVNYLMHVCRRRARLIFETLTRVSA